MSLTPAFFLGTSGWSYEDWVGPFYERSEKKFSYYTRFFHSAEVNSTFYRYPTKSMIYGFYRTAPRDFIFSVKLPKHITHEKVLSSNLKVENDLLRFLELMEPLKIGEKLGAVLIQLPPKFVYHKNLGDLESFLEILPKDYEFAVEFRNHSWLRNETWKLLKNHNVAYTIVDEPLLPPETHITADFAYVRWHGKGVRPWYNYHYSAQELKEWIPRVKKISEKVEKIYGYFNNHYHGYAAENCVEILEMLEKAKPEQRKIKKKIIQYNLKRRPLSYIGKPDAAEDLSQLGINDLLFRMTDDGRLERARKIKDEELTITKATEKTIEATIRDYTILVDLRNGSLIHNCDDWRKGLGTRRICKHIAKLFYQLPEDKSVSILKDIIKRKEKWNFKTTS